ncbi:hypothetical protein ncot_04535 [Nocardioides sp. JQ2195]|uniref:AAA family ATPase n=1 Tax=Nocardioides sp. JQ2195 TaxID=2592334 RepID=UPI00143E6A75|nr:hypothetical protein [Nocardioides sp. JQ2195]QIX25948.1 hypothetical protein ncot_04535 [Nocardioides sp. JQ2195]
MEGQTCILVLAAGAPWESTALPALTRRPGIVVVKRCVDVTDLLASATTGQADVAVVSLDAPGLDGPAVQHLRHHGVEPVAVLADAGRGDLGDRMNRLGLVFGVGVDQVDHLPDAVLAAGAADQGQEPTTRPGPAMGAGHGRCTVVWGPAGAPGRTTLALAIAGEFAQRGAAPLVIDADPWGGSVGQHLGILDDVSGLLACARASAAGELGGSYLGLQRRVGGLRVITGLPRPDRWVEARVGLVEQLVELGRRQGEVVLDTGFALEDDPAAEFSGRPSRNGMTLEALSVADDVVVVGNADPIGLSRLARGLVELRETIGGKPVRVVVNRMRSSVGWSEAEVTGMVNGFAELSGVHFLPDDRGTTDRALLGGRMLAELGDSALSKAVARLVDGLRPGTARAGGRRLSRRRAVPARRS